MSSSGGVSLMSEAGSEEFSGVGVGSFLLCTLELGRRPSYLTRIERFWTVTPV